MSRNTILTLAALATLASATFAAGSVNAMDIRRGDGGHPPGHHVFGHPHWHEHVHLRPVYGHVYVRPVGYTTVVEPGPCTCLWKGYTPDGTVVFKDMCTKEMASAPIDDEPAQASEAQSPSNFAGKTYQDYLAANPPSAATPKQDTPVASQKTE